MMRSIFISGARALHNQKQKPALLQLLYSQL